MKPSKPTAAQTPGPWRVGDAGHTVFGPKTDAPSPEIVAQKVTRANAALIAAAPALLQAARRAWWMMSDLEIPSVKTRVGYEASVTRAALAAAIEQAGRRTS